MAEGVRTVGMVDGRLFAGEQAMKVIEDGTVLLGSFTGQPVDDIRTPLREYLERHATAISSNAIATYRKALYDGVESRDWDQLTTGLRKLLIASQDFVSAIQAADAAAALMWGAQR